MKLPIRKKYFDEIKAGAKTVEFRDAHITFVCEETGEALKRDVLGVRLINDTDLPTELANSGLFDDKVIIAFDLKPKKK